MIHSVFMVWFPTANPQLLARCDRGLSAHQNGPLRRARLVLAVMLPAFRITGHPRKPEHGALGKPGGDIFGFGFHGFLNCLFHSLLSGVKAFGAVAISAFAKNTRRVLTWSQSESFRSLSVYPAMQILAASLHCWPSAFVLRITILISSLVSVDWLFMVVVCVFVTSCDARVEPRVPWPPFRWEPFACDKIFAIFH